MKFQRVPTFAFKKPYTSFKTAKGIRIGSKSKAFRRAYPKARRVDEGGLTLYSYTEYAIRKGNVRTLFEVAAGRVAGIEIEDLGEDD